ncbi:WAP four-disulfide core domain protein 2 [Xenopus laevis]|uniref:WAP four-disulfide core domain protein 2 n=2 Tax=Xenopus laevis TaxID=8355 RepID=A0A1L8GPF0_XENLA|nr:WAP four-disulfide core domain protein 2 [Xenopus laevis]OCT85700.1 hypothetical protein XELAEV_18023871mg [Xenopus laevis]
MPRLRFKYIVSECRQGTLAKNRMKIAACLFAALLVKLACTQESTNTTVTQRDKPGVCPDTNLSLGICGKECKTDMDCGNNLKCCKTGCDGLQCQEPDEKPGSCPKPSNETVCVTTADCRADSKCEGQQKCCPTGCGGYTCHLPIELKEISAT